MIFGPNIYPPPSSLDYQYFLYFKCEMNCIVSSYKARRIVQVMSLPSDTWKGLDEWQKKTHARSSAITSRHSISIPSDTLVFRNEMESAELEQFACGTLIVFTEVSRTPRYELQLAQLGSPNSFPGKLSLCVMPENTPEIQFLKSVHLSIIFSCQCILMVRRIVCRGTLANT